MTLSTDNKSLKKETRQKVALGESSLILFIPRQKNIASVSLEYWDIITNAFNIKETRRYDRSTKCKQKGQKNRRNNIG